METYEPQITQIHRVTKLNIQRYLTTFTMGVFLSRSKVSFLNKSPIDM
jgi:hypothetical protein